MKIDRNVKEVVEYTLTLSPAEMRSLRTVVREFSQKNCNLRGLVIHGVAQMIEEYCSNYREPE